MPDFLYVWFPTAGVETWLWLPFLVALAISFFTSMAGVSGAFLILPFQMSVLGYTDPSVSATNLLYNVVATPGGIYRYGHEGRMDWPLAWAMGSGIVPGMLLGYYLRVSLLPDAGQFRLFAGGVLAYVGLRQLWVVRRAGPDAAHGEARPSGNPHTGLPRGLWPASLAVGAVGGTYGIGGGALLAPLCVSVFHLPIKQVAGATLFATLVSSVAGVAIYTLVPVAGHTFAPDRGLGLLFGAGGLAGIYLGARTQRYVSETRIRLLLGGLILVLGLRYLLGLS